MKNIFTPLSVKFRRWVRVTRNTHVMMYTIWTETYLLNTPRQRKILVLIIMVDKNLNVDQHI